MELWREVSFNSVTLREVSKLVPGPRLWSRRFEALLDVSACRSTAPPALCPAVWCTDTGEEISWDSEVDI